MVSIPELNRGGLEEGRGIENRRRAQGAGRRGATAQWRNGTMAQRRNGATAQRYRGAMAVVFQVVNCSSVRVL